MEKRIVFTNPDGSVGVIIPAKKTSLSIEEIMRKDVPSGAVSAQIVDASDVPTDRSYRNAWSFDHAQKKFGHDMAKAKELHKEKLRALRAPLLEALDVEYQKADEIGDNQKKKEIAAKKQALRDVTKHAEILGANDIESLKHAGMSVIEGKEISDSIQPKVSFSAKPLEV